MFGFDIAAFGTIEPIWDLAGTMFAVKKLVENALFKQLE